MQDGITVGCDVHGSSRRGWEGFDLAQGGGEFVYGWENRDGLICSGAGQGVLFFAAPLAPKGVVTGGLIEATESRLATARVMLPAAETAAAADVVPAISSYRFFGASGEELSFGGSRLAMGGGEFGGVPVPRNGNLIIGTNAAAKSVVTATGATTELSSIVYSVAFETELAAAQFGLRRAAHFQIANEALEIARATDPALAQTVPEPMGWGRPPAGWTWQHATIEQARGRAGILQLVPKSQHTQGSIFWDLLHPLPNSRGGYWEWAIPAGAPPN